MLLFFIRLLRDLKIVSQHKKLRYQVSLVQCFPPNKTEEKIIKSLKDNKDNTIKYQNESHTANTMGKK